MQSDFLVTFLKTTCRRLLASFQVFFFFWNFSKCFLQAFDKHLIKLLTSFEASSQKLWMGLLKKLFFQLFCEILLKFSMNFRWWFLQVPDKPSCNVLMNKFVNFPSKPKWWRCFVNFCMQASDTDYFLKLLMELSPVTDAVFDKLLMKLSEIAFDGIVCKLRMKLSVRS